LNISGFFAKRLVGLSEDADLRSLSDSVQYVAFLSPHIPIALNGADAVQ
jgi:hypothetical protein